MNVEPKIKNGVGIGKTKVSKIENCQKTAKKRLRRIFWPIFLDEKLLCGLDDKSSDFFLAVACFFCLFSSFWIQILFSCILNYNVLQCFWFQQDLP